MSIANSSHLWAIALSLTFATSSFARQSPSSEDDTIDALVDDVWGGAPAGEQAASALELSLEAAKSIGLANDLSLQGSTEYAEAARYREIGSWGAFDWIFNASVNLEESTQDSTIAGDPNDVIDLYRREASVGFQRAFRGGDSFSVSLGHNNGSSNSFIGSSGNVDVLSAAYTRPLMRGAGEDYATSAQEIAGLRSERELEAIRLQRKQLILDIELKYWDLVLAKRQLEVAGSALDLAIEQLQRDRRRREAGVATDVEVIQDEATVARRIEGVLLVETALETAMDRLRSTLFPGVEAGSWGMLVMPITAMPEVMLAPVDSEWDSEIRRALSQRCEVKLAEMDVEIATVLHARTVSEKRSSLDFLFQLGSQGFEEDVGDSLGEAFGFDYPRLAAGLVYQIPMGNTSLLNEERAARAELRAARFGLDSIKSQVANEVREALRQVRYQAEASRAATKTREAAERLVAAERARYEQGLATNFQVLEFHQALVEAQYAERAGRTAYCQALATLEMARGSVGQQAQGASGVDAP